MPLFFALITVNIMIVSMLACSKKENENPSQETTLNRTAPPSETRAQLDFSPIQKRDILRPRSDIYHKITEDLAYPASVRCQNHEDVWRILALYLDCIRAVNAEEFAKFRLMDSALAVMHDFTRYIRVDGLTNDTVALAVVYFLVDYYKIEVKLGAPDTPWFSILNRSVKLENLESIRILIENELISR